MVANNTVALNQLFECNKYQISMFLIELLAKKACSVSFVSQYILCRSIMWVISLANVFTYDFTYVCFVVMETQLVHGSDCYLDKQIKNIFYHWSDNSLTSKA